MLDRSVPSIAGDSNRLRQAVWRVLINAIKFSPDGGHVQVRLTRVGSFIEITISDNGSGIEADFLPFVFDHFRQEAYGTNKPRGGLGVGLAIVRDVITMHGGTVRVESTGKNQGATFVLRLPISPVRANGKPVAPATSHHAAPGWSECPPQLAGLKVLVVEQEAATREAISHALRYCQAEVCAADSISQALAVLDDSLPDVLVAAWDASGDGVAALLGSLRRLEIARARKIPALALIDQQRPADRIPALAAGFQLHLNKPVDTEELLMLVAGVGGRLNQPNNLQALRK